MRTFTSIWILVLVLLSGTGARSSAQSTMDDKQEGHRPKVSGVAIKFAWCGCTMGITLTLRHPAPNLTPDHLRLHPIASFKLNRQERLDAYDGSVPLFLRSISHYALEDGGDEQAADLESVYHYEEVKRSERQDPVVEVSTTPKDLAQGESPINSLYTTHDEVLITKLFDDPTQRLPFIVDNPYPNPATSSTNWISLPIQTGQYESVQIELFDQLGRVIGQETARGDGRTTQTVHFPRPLESGMYYFRVTVPDQTLMRAFMVTR